ncbi:hypothetical protein [Haladaptatus caseinilyticus]|uniref:hypothetical protein n=1 Tax=Haladaptatus caseinilyticus TaxID=2993314 RepID=UPI00224B7933|nr:hypothetical protein [Haladaptatus caseinilyticus]
MARDSSKTKHDRRICGSLVDRRSYLKLTGSTALAVAGVGTFGGGAAAAEYETITIPANTQKQFQVGSGETFENTLIDISATGADARIVASGSDWTIRNVGFTGAADMSGPHSPGKNLGGYPNLIAASGTGTIEHVYLGDGVSGDMVRKGAIGVSSSHDGHINLNEVTMNGWTGNAIYAGGAAKSSGGGGTLAFDRCLLKNNNISHLRIATDGTTVKNTVIYNTEDVPLHPINGGVVNSRGVYDGYGTSGNVIEFENCHIDCTDANTNGGASALAATKTTFRVKDSQVKGQLIGNVETTNVGENPSHEPPKGAPTTAEQAASGSGASGGNSENGGSSAKTGTDNSGNGDNSGSKSGDNAADSGSSGDTASNSSDSNDTSKKTPPADAEVNEQRVSAAPGSADSYCFTYEGRRYCFDFSNLSTLVKQLI